jgi:hypothetical protein
LKEGGPLVYPVLHKPMYPLSRSIFRAVAVTALATFVFISCEKKNDAIMRLYWPKTEPPSILPPGEGTWKPPGVVKAN